LRLDPAAEKLVDMKNPRRVLRALEVTTFTGKPFTEQKGAAKPVIDPLMIGLKREREELKERINLAVEAYVEAGWIDEIRRLNGSGIGWDAPAMTSIGYRELGAYIRGESTSGAGDRKNQASDLAIRQAPINVVQARSAHPLGEG
jgi:tRNA dimethylallyltransferase